MVAFRNSIMVAFLFGLLTSVSSAEERTPPNIINVPLVAWVAQQDRAMPDSFHDFSFPREQAMSFQEMVAAIAQQEWEVATSLAGNIGYEIVSIPNGAGFLVAAVDRSHTGQNPTIVVNTNAELKLIVGAPHASFETGTAEQAAIIVSDIGARAAVVAGAHRCAARKFVECDGRTSVCGSIESYRTSDVAHNPDSLFHHAHVVLTDIWPDDIVMSLHGMREDKDGVRTSIILSHGYKSESDSGNSTSTLLRFALATRFGSDGQVVSCDLAEDSQYQARRLCGYTNVQGRHVNQDEDVCVGSAESGSDLFVHIEQDWSILRAFDREWGSSERNEIIQDFLAAVRETVPRIER